MIEIVKTGFYDTIQDLGRMGFQEYGVPISGVMDAYSARLANAIIGNDSHAAVMECVASGPQLKCHTDTLICITGAHMNASLNDYPIKNNTAIAVSKGDVITFGACHYGFRMYLSVFGGFQTELSMKSRSMYPGITSKQKLSNGDKLEILKLEQPVKTSFSSIKVDKNHFETKVIDVFEGPEFYKLNPDQQKDLMAKEFSISKDSNRMAYQCNELFKNNLEPIITSLVLPGTVQLTPSGQLLILMRDCQTTGGYPRILQLTEQAINQLSQKFFGSKIRFKCIK